MPNLVFLENHGVNEGRASTLPLHIAITNHLTICQSEAGMNPEVEEQITGPGKLDKATAKKHHFLQRRLKDQISESRMLEVLDRQLQVDRPSEKLDSNQEEEELVCVSTMVAVEPGAASASSDQRVCGVLKTVRCMHRQRADEEQRDENQSDHSRLTAASKS